MEYTGKLYGKIGSEYFDTGKTAKDFDALKDALTQIKELESSERINAWYKSHNIRPLGY